eukprot:TRINITY_DN1806_c0_g1_i1.p1 TRINITY_DN1806_c0_g1~~TRINITY_DN1806_c0_g1_i1.p1  ORF type:complete len:261 (+),score=53.95 TRINITY_DN1806_c0_g1_i1:112-894(+)
MVRGPRHHLRRLNAPKHWMLDKLGGVWAPRPSSGPHKLRECLPLIILLREKLQYATTRREVITILMNRLIQVDHKVRTDPGFPTGFMDVITIPKTGENYRLLYDVKGRFKILPIQEEEASFKLCRVVRYEIGAKGIPFIVTHDGRTIRYPHPDIKKGDTIKFDLKTGEIVKFAHFKVGNIAMITGGANTGRVGQIVRRERHIGSHEIIHLKDANGVEFATRSNNVFILGDGSSSLVSLPKDRGVKATIEEDREYRLKDKN